MSGSVDSDQSFDSDEEDIVSNNNLNKEVAIIQNENYPKEVELLDFNKEYLVDQHSDNNNIKSVSVSDMMNIDKLVDTTTTSRNTINLLIASMNNNNNRCVIPDYIANISNNNPKYVNNIENSNENNQEVNSSEYMQDVIQNRIIERNQEVTISIKDSVVFQEIINSPLSIQKCSETEYMENQESVITSTQNSNDGKDVFQNSKKLPSQKVISQIYMENHYSMDSQDRNQVFNDSISEENPINNNHTYDQISQHESSDNVLLDQNANIKSKQTLLNISDKIPETNSPPLEPPTKSKDVSSTPSQLQRLLNSTLFSQDIGNTSSSNCKQIRISI